MARCWDLLPCCKQWLQWQYLEQIKIKVKTREKDTIEFFVCILDFHFVTIFSVSFISTFKSSWRWLFFFLVMILLCLPSGFKGKQKWSISAFPYPYCYYRYQGCGERVFLCKRCFFPLYIVSIESCRLCLGR